MTGEIDILCAKIPDRLRDLPAAFNQESAGYGFKKMHDV